jgi:hypothetical protein
VDDVEDVGDEERDGGKGDEGEDESAASKADAVARNLARGVGVTNACLRSVLVASLDMFAIRLMRNTNDKNFWSLTSTTTFRLEQRTTRLVSSLKNSGI